MTTQKEQEKGEGNISEISPETAETTETTETTKIKRPISTTFEDQRHDGKPNLSITKTTKLWDPDASTLAESRPTSTVNDTSNGNGNFNSNSNGKTTSTLTEKESLSNEPAVGGSLNQESEEPAEIIYPGPLALAFLIIGICLSVFLISLDRTIITTAIPYITSEFNSSADIGWYGSSYLLTASAFQPLYGRIFMLFNIKWSYLFAVFLFSIGSLICGIAPDSLTLIVGRAVAGLGSAGILTGSFVVVAHSVSLRMRPVWTAVVGLMFGIGATVGPLLGGVFTDLITWRWCFYFNLPVAGTTIIAMIIFFKPKTTTTTTTNPQSFYHRVLDLDILGNIILLAASIMLFLALEYTNQSVPWGSAEIIGLLTGSGTTFVIFAIWQRWKSEGALMPPRILTQRTVASSCMLGFFIYSTILLQSYYLPIYFQAIKGTSAIHSGINMIPYVLANAIFSLLAGIFVSKNGFFTGPAIIGCAIGTIGCGFLSTLKVDTSLSMWVGFEFLTSAGIGMAIQQGFTAVQSVLPLDEVPIGTAAVVAFQSLGGAIFVSVGNTILQNRLLDAADANSLPGVDVQAVIHAGASEFRDHVSEDALPALLVVYNAALQKVFLAAVPLCALAFVSSLFLEWRSVKGPKEREASREDVEAVPAEDGTCDEKGDHHRRASTISQNATAEQIPRNLIDKNE